MKSMSIIMHMGDKMVSNKTEHFDNDSTFRLLFNSFASKLNKAVKSGAILMIITALMLVVLVQAQDSSISASVKIPFKMSIISPINKVYNTSSIMTNISLNAKATSLTYSLNGVTYKSLCKNCNLYAKAIKFSEGLNNLTVRAITNQTYYQNVIFTIDSLAPKLKKSTASSKGNFSISYTEANPVKVFLYYGLNVSNLNNKKELIGCPYGAPLNLCLTSVNVSSFNGKTLYYSFTVNDTFYSSKSSKPGKIVINTAAGAKYAETSMSETSALGDLLGSIADFFR